MFAQGGVGDWLPTFIQRTQDSTNIGQVGIILSVCLATSSVLGSPLGTFIADKLQFYTRNSYFLSCGTGYIISGAFSIGVLLLDNLVLVGLFLFAQFMSDSAASPCIATIIVNNVDPSLRGRAYAIHVTFIHLLGDSLSPLIIGALSDATGDLLKGMLVLPAASAVAGLIMLLGWRLVPQK
jgi:sugar phosphate permease